MILQGRPLMTTKPFFRRAEHCMGYVAEAPAAADGGARQHKPKRGSQFTARVLLTDTLKGLVLLLLPFSVLDSVRHRKGFF